MVNADATQAALYGHEVLGLLQELGGASTVLELKAAAFARFGPDAVFRNCHGDFFDLTSLLAFLMSRGKLLVLGDRVYLGPAPPCDHA